MSMIDMIICDQNLYKLSNIIFTSYEMINFMINHIYIIKTFQKLKSIETK
jgi:hypothetical protein